LDGVDRDGDRSSSWSKASQSPILGLAVLTRKAKAVPDLVTGELGIGIVFAQVLPEDIASRI
jgi:hypothetical protein